MTPGPARAASMRGRQSRRVGAAWECACAELLRTVYPGAKRGLQARGAAADAVPDVQGTPLWPECKTGKCPNPRAALKQAERDCRDGRIKVVMIHDNAPRPGEKAREWVCMPMADWLQLLAAAEGVDL